MEEELKLVWGLVGSKEIEAGKNSSFQKFCWEKKQRNGIITEEETEVREQFVILLVG